MSPSSKRFLIQSIWFRERFWLQVVASAWIMPLETAKVVAKSAAAVVKLGRFLARAVSALLLNESQLVCGLSWELNWTALRLKALHPVCASRSWRSGGKGEVPVFTGIVKGTPLPSSCGMS
eukprot:3488391-Heterocapsa_arctica.AAC.1